MTPSFPRLFLSSAANRTTANKQEVPCTQTSGVWRRSCPQTTPQQHNCHIPCPPHRCVGKPKVCVQTLQIRGRGTSPRDNHHCQGWSGADAACASCLSTSGPAAPRPPPGPNFHRLGWLPSSSRALISTCCNPGSWVWPTCQGQGTGRNTFPKRTCWELLFKPGRSSFLFMPKSVFYNHERERERERQRQSKERGRERESFQEERKS